MAFTDNLEPRRQAALERLSELSRVKSRQNAMMMSKAEKRYQEYMDEMRRREEAARRAKEGSWFSNIFKGGVGGAITGGIGGLLMGGPAGAAIGAGIGGASGAGMGALGRATGTQDFMFGTAMPMMMQGMAIGASGRLMGGGSYSPYSTGSASLISRAPSVPPIPYSPSLVNSAGLAGPYFR